AAVRAQLERRGRSMTTVSVRMEQGDRVLALALAACSSPRDAIEWDDADAPDVAPPEALEAPPEGPTTPLNERYEVRRALGSPPFGGGGEAHSGGWIRLRREE